MLQEEATWSEEESDWEIDEDAGMEDAAAGAAAMADGGHHAAAHGHAQGQRDGRRSEQGAAASPQQEEGPQADAAYINIFLLKYVCPREACRGTLAPLAPPGRPDVLECNMCGGQRTEAEFLAELEAME